MVKSQLLSFNTPAVRKKGILGFLTSGAGGCTAVDVTSFDEDDSAGVLSQSSGVITATNMARNSTLACMSYDTGSSISSQTWTVSFTLNLSAMANDSSWFFVVSNTQFAKTDVAQNAIGFCSYKNPPSSYWQSQVGFADNETLSNSHLNSTGSSPITIATGTNYYVQYSQVASNQVRMRVRSGSQVGTILSEWTVTNSAIAGLNDLRYINFQNQTGYNQQLSGTIRDVKWYEDCIPAQE